MSSDQDLRNRVRALLQTVVNDRKYQQGELMYPIRGAGKRGRGAYIGGTNVGGVREEPDYFITDKSGKNIKNLTEKQLANLVKKANKPKKKIIPNSKKCPKGYNKKCVLKGSGNIYDYNYGDGCDENYGRALVGGTMVGGKKRRPGVKCQMKKKKIRSAWICHVKKYAKAHNISYGEALKKAKPSYNKGKGLGNMFYN